MNAAELRQHLGYDNHKIKVVDRKVVKDIGNIEYLVVENSERSDYDTLILLHTRMRPSRMRPIELPDKQKTTSEAAAIRYLRRYGGVIHAKRTRSATHKIVEYSVLNLVNGKEVYITN